MSAGSHAGRATVCARPARCVSGVVAVATAMLALAAGGARAATPGPGWTIQSLATPTVFSATGAYEVTATNSGSLPTDGSAIELTDRLPAGLTVSSLHLYWSGGSRHPPLASETDLAPKLCTTTLLRCVFPGPLASEDGVHALAPDDTLRMTITVAVGEGAASPLRNEAAVAGGGASQAATSDQNPLGGPAAAFGIAGFAFLSAGPDGLPETQAAGHPYELSLRVGLNNVMRIAPDSAGGELSDTSVKDVKDLIIDLPLGFLADARATPQCTFAQLSGGAGGCPPGSVVGHISTEPASGDYLSSPIYDMVPEHGVAAEFGFDDEIGGSHVLYASVAPTASGYVLRVSARELPQISLTSVWVTLFGDPAARDGAPLALLTEPSYCGGEPLASTVYVDAWQDPGSYNADGTPNLDDQRWVRAGATLPPVTGCNELGFAPSLTAQPEATPASATDSPAGLTLAIDASQPREFGALAAPPVRDLGVTLPPGFTLNLASAAGLQACSERQVGFVAIDEATAASEFDAAPPACPQASKIGTATLSTAILPGPLSGSVYLAQPNANPFGSLLAVYVVIDDPETGVLLKIPGALSSDPVTGQLAVSLRGLPPLPFSELRLRLKSGPRGLLATPTSCGAFTTTGRLTPWSAPDSGPPATPVSETTIDRGCAQGFAPRVTGGTVDPRAGAYSPLVLSISREDSEQELGRLAVTLPQGVAARLAGTSACPEAALAAAATSSAVAEMAAPWCPAASEVGTVTAAVGVGEPLFLSGREYLTGPFDGAPYGLATILPAAAGPFDLGTLVLRQALRVDPTDGQLEISSQPLPVVLRAAAASGQGNGFVLRLRRLDISLDRPEFVVNPTSCRAESMETTLTSTGGVVATAGQRFQAAGCRELRFAPRLTASLATGARRESGAGLTARLAFPSLQPGTEANVAKLKLDLPRQLSIRLSTLQRACRARVFDADPAACPAGSAIGHAQLRSPLLSSALEGPVYLVGNGAARLPDVSVVLQGEGLVLELTGVAGIGGGGTSVAFRRVPDLPMTSFTIDLSAGSGSLLVANLPAGRRLCSKRLRVPTALAAQNGSQIHQLTALSIRGCDNARRDARRAARRAGRGAAGLRPQPLGSR